jgi:uncharacterized membrane protein YhaH (DUF805 family)
LLPSGGKGNAERLIYKPQDRAILIREHHPRPMINDYKMFWKNAFDLRGRASRAQYWNTQVAIALVILFLMIVLVGIYSAFASIGGAAFSYLLYGYALAILIPQLTLQVRRIRDTGISLWWLLLVLIPGVGPFAILIILCLPSRSEA